MQPFLSMIGLKPKPLGDGPRYAMPNDRCMASAIDVTILFLLLSNVTEHVTEQIYAFYEQLPPSALPHVSSFNELAHMIWLTRYPWVISNTLTVAIMGAVFIGCQCVYGTTPGKWLLGLKIIDVKTHEPIRGWRYAWRFLMYIPSAVPLMIGVIWGSFNKRHRMLHDYMAGTNVIYTRPKGWYWQKIKQGFFWLKAKAGLSREVEEPVGEPTTEQRHENSTKPIE